MILPSGQKRTTLLIAIAAVLGAWVFIGGVVMPAVERSGALDRKIRAARLEQEKVAEMAERYTRLSASLPPALKGNEPPKTSISDDVGSIARRLGADRYIKRLTPSVNPRTGRQDEVAANIEGIPYTLLIDLLQGVYDSSSAISVRRARVGVTFDNRNNVNAEITFAGD